MSDEPTTREIFVRNIEPAWVKYGLTVAIPTDTPEDRVREVVMDKVYASEYEVQWGPEVIDTISGMDQEFEVEGYEPEPDPADEPIETE